MLKIKAKIEYVEIKTRISDFAEKTTKTTRFLLDYWKLLRLENGWIVRILQRRIIHNGSLYAFEMDADLIFKSDLDRIANEEVTVKVKIMTPTSPFIIGPLRKWLTRYELVPYRMGDGDTEHVTNIVYTKEMSVLT